MGDAGVDLGAVQIEARLGFRAGSEGCKYSKKRQGEQLTHNYSLDAGGA